MGTVLRALGWIGVLLVGLIAWVVIGGREVSRYKCAGELIAENSTTKDAVLFVELTRYQLPITLWADNDGTALAEVPHGPSGLFHVKDIGQMLTLTPFSGNGAGYWSETSYAIDVPLQFGEGEDFKGACEPIDWRPL